MRAEAKLNKEEDTTAEEEKNAYVLDEMKMLNQELFSFRSIEVLIFFRCGVGHLIYLLPLLTLTLN